MKGQISCEMATARKEKGAHLEVGFRVPEVFELRAISESTIERQAQDRSASGSGLRKAQVVARRMWRVTSSEWSRRPLGAHSNPRAEPNPSK